MMFYLLLAEKSHADCASPKIVTMAELYRWLNMFLVW